MRASHFVLLILLILQSSTMMAASNDDKAKRREATKSELSKLQAKIKRLQKSQAKNRSSLTKEQKALKKNDVLIGRSRKSLDTASTNLRKSQSRLKSLNIKQKGLQSDKKQQQKALKDQIRAAYAGGKQEYLKLLFNQEDPSLLGRTLVYYSYLNAARLEKIQQLDSTIKKLTQVETQITVEQKQLRQLKDELKQENTRLTSLKAVRQKVISQLNSSLKSNTKQLKEWQENETDLISLIEALKQSVSVLIPEESLNGLASLKGKLNWPVKGRVRETFGSPRGIGQIRWSGVLIAAKEGQEVNAIYHGRIVYSDYLRGFGLITIIDHGDGYMSLYGHNEALYKQPGDWVEAGERIATVGQSGGYPSIGLYFEIRLRSKAVNPIRFIRRG